MDDPSEQLRTARRAFVREHHPDRGGDPAAFAAGLARLDRHLAAACGAAERAQAGVVTVLRRPRGALGWLRHLTGLAAAAAGRRGRPRRVR